MQLQELNSSFTKVNTELLLYVTSLNPNDSFIAFDKQKLIRFALFYPKDFSPIELMVLNDQLQTYIIDEQSNDQFSQLKGISDLARKMVETKKHIVYPFVFLLVTLVLILPVATTTVKRTFYTMNIVKNRLQNRMEDQWMDDQLLVYVEKDIFDSINNDTIMQHFQNMKTR